MIDLVKLTLKAGDGGNGRVAFRREKYIPKGGPNGGDGGRGGSIILRVNPKLTTLQHLAHVKQFIADSGAPGGKQLMTGESGEDVIIEVPVGTVVWMEAENRASRIRREKYGVKWATPKSDARFTKFYLSKEGEGIPAREADVLEPIDPAVQLEEFTPDSGEIVIAQGGFGGKGNDRFKSSINTTPLEAEYGTFGEQKVIFLELKLLADVGLVGLPNAGKSTLLSRLTNARPKIANYPFTTLEPHLGILTLGQGNDAHDIVMADIPGLIEGAHEGKGLGFTFLRHVEHCQMLLYVLALPDEMILDDSVGGEDKAQALWQQFQTLQSELRSHSLSFLAKKHVLIVNKIDIYNKVIIDQVQKIFDQKNEGVLFISAVTGEGLDQLKKRLQQELA